MHSQYLHTCRVFTPSNRTELTAHEGRFSICRRDPLQGTRLIFFVVQYMTPGHTCRALPIGPRLSFNMLQSFQVSTAEDAPTLQSCSLPETGLPFARLDLFAAVMNHELP
jgi:hypothetical protein